MAHLIVRSAFCAVVLVCSSALAQRDLREIPPTDPELERRSFEVAEGFEVNLFAGDPQIAKPIQMNFDPQGRLWIVSSEVYPHIEPGQQAKDKVLVVEDTDGNGAADKTTVFADGLLIPTGVEPGDGGAYVANSTELLHFQDEDGDLRADSQRIVLSGFGTEDTHHIIHTFRWGPEQRLYFNQSIYIHSHIETPYGVRRLGGGGIWQLRPESLRLDVFARGWINPWGHHFDDYGQSFVTDGAGGEGINYAVPGAAYPTAVGVPRILHGLNPGHPKYCGLEVVGGRHLPDDWQGNLITNDFRGHRVVRFTLDESGSGFAATQQPDLIRTSHVAFRPIDVKMGPDGAIYIADWYNPIIQHGEVDFRDPRRDHTHGRIWRVTYKGRPLVPRPDLVGASTPELLGFLKAPEGWTRQNAKRVLKERGADVLPVLVEWVRKLNPADPLVERHRLEGLWVCQAHDHVEPELLDQLLRAKDHRVRAAATRVLQDWAGRLPDALELLEPLVRDEHPRVRLEAVRALAVVRQPRAIQIAMAALEQPLDQFLDYALWLTARDLQAVWLPLVARDELEFEYPEQLVYALRAVGTPAIVPPLVRLLGKEPDLDAGTRAMVLDLIAQHGRAEDLRIVLDLALEEKSDESRAALLNALADAAQRRNARPAGDLDALIPWLKLDSAVDSGVQRAAIRCAGQWKLESARDPLIALVRSDRAAREARREALFALAEIGGAAAKAVLTELAGTSEDGDEQQAALAALCRLDLESAAEVAVRYLEDLSDPAKAPPVVNAFLQQKRGATVLAKHLNGRRLPSDVAKLGLRAIDTAGGQATELAEALTRAGDLAAGPRELTPAEMQSLVREVREHGDPARGEAVYRRAELSCQKCHAIGGAGGQVGPDLVSIGASAQVDYLIDSLLQPNKQIKENYHSVVVVTTEGRVFTGVKVRQTDTELILRDAEDRELSVPLASIEDQVDGKSLMPAGLTDKLTRSELVDLVRFLSELGKVGSYSVGPHPVVRRWEVLQPTREAAVHLRRTSDAAAATDAPAFQWSSVYSTVAGLLPLEDLPELRVPNKVAAGTRRLAFVRFEMDVSESGPVVLDPNSPDGLTLWVDGEAADVSSATRLDLTQGRHRLTLAVDLSERSTPLQIHLGESASSAGQAIFVGGK